MFLTEIKEEHLKPYSDKIKGKTALVIRTGYDKWLEANKKHNPKNIPYFTKEATYFINRFKDIKVVGTDSLTVDKPMEHYAHQKFKDNLLVECLVNLHSIPEKNRFDFDLQTSPIAIIGATGGPVNAYAFIKLNNGDVNE